MTTNRFMTLINGIRTIVTAISTSAGATDANKIVATETTGRLHISLMPTGIGASTEVVTTSEALAAGDLVNIWNNAGTRNVRKADAGNGRFANGFVTASVASAQPATVFLQGQNTAVTGQVAGTILFLSATTPGAVTATAPSAVGNIVQEVGIALSATSLLFEYDGFTTLA